MSSGLPPDFSWGTGGMKFGGFDRANRWVDGGGLVAWRSSSAEQALISPRLLCTGRLLCSARGAEQGRDQTHSLKDSPYPHLPCPPAPPCFPPHTTKTRYTHYVYDMLVYTQICIVKKGDFPDIKMYNWLDVRAAVCGALPVTCLELINHSLTPPLCLVPWTPWSDISSHQPPVGNFH